MRISAEQRADFLAILAATPPYLARLIETASDESLLDRPGANDWSVAENLVHIDACARFWGTSIDRMLAEDGGVQGNQSPRGQTEPTPVSRSEFNDIASAFNERRRLLLTQLASIAPEDWERSAMIGGEQHTVSTQIRRMALHEQVHIEQVAATLERTFRSDSLDT